MRNGLVSSAPRRVAVPLSLGVITFLLSGCSGYIYVTPPASNVTVSQGIPALGQTVVITATKKKPVLHTITVKQTVPGLSQKASGSVRSKPRNIAAKQNLPSLGQKTTGKARQPGSFSDEYSPEYQ